MSRNYYFITKFCFANLNTLAITVIKSVFVLMVLLFACPFPNLIAQTTTILTIEDAYQKARINYPLIKQRALISKTKSYSVNNASKGYLPVFSINGQATYQSSVTTLSLPIKGFTMPEFNKDQYKLYGEIDQVIYDGGVIRNQKQTIEANEQIQQQNLELELYALYDRINQLFLGALLIKEQLKQNELLQKDIENGIDKTTALVNNGTAFKSSVDELKAQLLQTEQTKIELQTLRKSYLNMIGLFTNSVVDETTVFIKPVNPEMTVSNNRPELQLYDYQKKTYDLQEKLLYTQFRPKFNMYVQGGYGRPGLNMLSNDFDWYYIGGLRLNWNFGSLYSLKNQKLLLGLNKETLDIQKETFLFNTNITLVQQNNDIIKYAELLKTDDKIIELRLSVKNSATVQLENGVLNTHDYLVHVNAENEAKQNKILHEVQLLQAQYNHKYSAGYIQNK